MGAILNHRDFILSVKLHLPESLWRAMTRPVAAVLKALPEKLVYSLGLMSRRGRLPYKVIKAGDVVIQIGAPFDLLAVGRSRAAYFLNLISGGGKLVVIEPDTKSAEAIWDYGARNGLSDRLIVVNAGAWHEETELSFFSSPSHPASAALVDVSEATPDEMRRRGYEEVRVPVTTVDNVLAKHGLKTPKLISITTNGAELQILDGMQNALADGVEYVSLAITGPAYTEAMEKLAYDHIADDDRGFTYQRGKR